MVEAVVMVVVVVVLGLAVAVVLAVRTLNPKETPVNQKAKPSSSTPHP